MELTSDINNLRATELRLGLPGTHTSPVITPRGSKRPLTNEGTTSSEADSRESFCPEAPVAKAQVIGWPPICSYRRNSLRTRVYVKVSMDGAPYLRKIDLNLYKEYEELKMALEDMFKCFSLGEVLAGMERCSKGSDYAVTYEDKEGDWMLVGDVPWEMFVSSCKRLRIMKGSEARGQEY